MNSANERVDYVRNQDDEIWMDIRHEIFTKAGIKITQLKDKLIGEQSVEGLSAAEILEKNIERKKNLDKSSAISRSINSTETALEMMINEFERLIPICKLEAEIATGVREKETSYKLCTFMKALKEHRNVSKHGRSNV